MRLYDYTLAFMELEELLMNEEVDFQTYQDTLKSLEGPADEKAENMCRMIDNFKAHIDALKREEDKLKRKRQTLENRIEWLESMLEAYLKVKGQDTRQVGIYRLGYRKLPDKVVILDEDKVPKAYRVPQPDKIPLTPLKQALQDGEEIPGVKLETNRIKFEIKK